VGPVWNPNRGLSPHLLIESHSHHTSNTNDKNQNVDERETSDIEALRLEYEDPFAIISSSLPSNTSKFKPQTTNKSKGKKGTVSNEHDNKSSEVEVDLSLL
jgi:hypothetical protein